MTGVDVNGARAAGRAVSPLATPPAEIAGHGLLLGKKVVVTAAAGTGIGFASANTDNQVSAPPRSISANRSRTGMRCPVAVVARPDACCRSDRAAVAITWIGNPRCERPRRRPSSTACATAVNASWLRCAGLR